jgi:transcriptional regulator with XRE-family HTH domain
MNMKDRIKLVMERENLTPTQFADRLRINRTVISHILNDRNNPSFDVIDKILRGMNINYDWLVYGEGEMYKQKAVQQNLMPRSIDLFSQSSAKEHKNTEIAQKPQETVLQSLIESNKVSDNKPVEVIKTVDKKVTQVIIYYSDNTFEVFRA